MHEELKIHKFDDKARNVHELVYIGKIVKIIPIHAF